MSPENKNLSVPSNICKHETTNIFHVKSNIEVCFGCSSIIYINESGKKFFQLNQKNLIYLKKHQLQFFYQYMIHILLIDFIIKKVI